MAGTLTTESVTAAVADALAWLGDSGFQYFKSYEHFRRKDGNGFSYVTINSVTHDRVSYDLAFYMGVQITEAEAWVLRLIGDNRKVSHYDRTIWNYTPNIGPKSPHWPYPVRGNWTLTSLAEFRRLAAEVSGFVKDLVLPFVDEHRDPLAVRRTLIERPGHATNICPYRSILAIDRLYGSPGQTEADIALLERRYEQYAPGPRNEFDQFVSAVRKTMNVKPGVAPNGGGSSGNSGAAAGSS